MKDSKSIVSEAPDHSHLPEIFKLTQELGKMSQMPGQQPLNNIVWELINDLAKTQAKGIY